MTIFTLFQFNSLLDHLQQLCQQRRAQIVLSLIHIYRETFEKWLETERIVCKPYFRLRPSIHPATYTEDVYKRQGI